MPNEKHKHPTEGIQQYPGREETIMKNNPFTRFLSVALTAAMLVGVMPGAVLADAGEAIVGASSAVVESVPETTTPADAAPVATEVPPVTEPEATPEAAQPEASPEVEATPEATEQPEATPEATQEPEATPEATEEPEATPEATEEPETSPEPTEEPVELNKEAYIETAEVAEGVTVTVKVPANTLPEDVDLVAEMLAEDTQAHADAEAALAEAEVQYDGMIAMDIRFEDAKGNEVEPANEVEVSIDAQALLPEDADPETVAVQHLKEDATGAVTVETVANTDAATGDITVAENADQPALNMASTFAVDGFSKFTITWDNEKSVTIVYCTSDGRQIAGTQTYPIEFELGKEVIVSDYAGSINGYQYTGNAYWASIKNNQYVTISYGDPVYSVKTITRSNWWDSYKQLQYRSSQDNARWNDASNNQNTICLVYSKNPGEPTQIETIETSKLGIQINLYDYTQNRVNDDNHALRFVTASEDDRDGINKYNPQGQTGIVEDSLSSGYPVLNYDGESLAYLFSQSEYIDNAYIGADKLFVQDSEGYYVYDSAQNFAKLNTRTRQFTVYDQQSLIYSPGSAQPNVLFAPFNNYGDEISRMNYHFGMTIETEFVMPVDGKINGKAMMFEFSGDDDVWVFLDGHLVLDLGGIHDECPGSINFSTGEVIANGVSQGNLWDKVDEKWEDYSTHTLQFFYLERGAGSSNCKIKFNLPTVPKGSLNVGKTAVGESADIDYTFEVTNGAGQPVASALYTIQGTSQTGTTDAQGIFTLKSGQVATFTGLTNGNYTVTELDGEGYYLSDYTTTVTTVDGSGSTAGHIATAGTVSIDPNTVATVGFTNTKVEKGEGSLKVIKEFDGAVPADLAIIRLTIKETYNPEGDSTVEESYTRTLELRKDAETGKFEGTLTGVRYYTDFAVEKEELLKADGTPIGNEADWRIGDFVLNRYAEADATAEFYPSCDTLVYTLPNSGYVLVKRGSQWYLVMNHVPEDAEARAAFKSMVIDDILTAVENVPRGTQPKSADEVQLITVREAAEIYNATVTFGEAGNVTLQFAAEKVWSNFYAGAFNMTNVTMSATLNNVLNRDAKTTVSVEKVWVDNNNPSRPTAVTVTLSSTVDSEVVTHTCTLNNANNWTYTFTNLPKYNADGTLVEYTVAEEVPNGYTADIIGDMETGFTITNTLANGYLTITKNLNNGQYDDGRDMFSFKVTATSGEKKDTVWYFHVNGAGDAVTAFELPVGNYTVQELNNQNYTCDLTSRDVTISAEDTETDPEIVIFTNTKKPTNIPTDGGGVENRFGKDSNGNIIITAKKHDEDTEVTPKENVVTD